jgi:hypothetical protein
VVWLLDKDTLMDVTSKDVQIAKDKDSLVGVQTTEIIRKKSILVWLGKEPD